MDSSGMGASTSSGSSSSSRYAYLVARLRNKQITMSEATELFEMQQSTLASALASANAPPPPPPPADYSGGPTPPPPGGPATPPVPSDDMFWMGMLAVGAGAGVLAALLRRGMAGDPSRPAPATDPRSRTP